jgi:hypothetical protein
MWKSGLFIYYLGILGLWIYISALRFVYELWDVCLYHPIWFFNSWTSSGFVQRHMNRVLTFGANLTGIGFKHRDRSGPSDCFKIRACLNWDFGAFIHRLSWHQISCGSDETWSHWSLHSWQGFRSSGRSWLWQALSLVPLESSWHQEPIWHTVGGQRSSETVVPARAWHLSIPICIFSDSFDLIIVSLD